MMTLDLMLSARIQRKSMCWFEHSFFVHDIKSKSNALMLNNQFSVITVENAYSLAADISFDNIILHFSFNRIGRCKSGQLCVSAN